MPNRSSTVDGVATLATVEHQTRTEIISLDAGWRARARWERVVFPADSVRGGQLICDLIRVANIERVHMRHSMEEVRNLDVPAPGIVHAKKEACEIVIVVSRTRFPRAAAIATLGRAPAKAEASCCRPGGPARVPFGLLLVQVLDLYGTAKTERMAAMDPTGVRAPGKLWVIAVVGHEVVLRPQNGKSTDAKLGHAAFEGARAIRG